MKHVTIMAFVLLPFLGCDTDQKHKSVEIKPLQIGIKEEVDSLKQIAREVMGKNPDSLFVLVDLIRKISLKVDYKEGIADAFNIIGVAYWIKGNLDKALESYFKSLQIREDILEKDPDNLALKGEVSKILNNIGLISVSQQNYNKALEYFRKDKEIINAILSEKSDSAVKSGLSVTLNNIGMALVKQGKREEALKTYREALNIAREVGNKAKIALCHNNIGDFNREEGDYAEALHNYMESMRINKELGRKVDLAWDLMNLGRLYKNMEMPEQALNYLKEALLLVKDVGAADLLRIIYDNLTEVNILLGNTKESLRYHNLHIAMKDSLNKKESSRNIAEMETRYETDKKKKEIKIQKLEIEKKDANIKNQRTGLILGVGIVLIIAVFALFLLRLYRKISKQKKETDASIRYASNIQRAILPPIEEVAELLPESFILLMPKDIVSGDFYWLAKKGGKILLAACDCTGHGVPGALMSVLCSSLLTEALESNKGINPALIFEKVRDRIKKELKQEGISVEQKDGMDAVLFSLDFDEMIISFVCANNPLFIVRDGELIVSKKDRQPVGVGDFREKPFENQEIKLQKGDVIYIFSDGYADQFGGRNDKRFMTKRFKNLLIDIYSNPMAEQKNRLKDVVTEWMGDKEQTDDILVIGVRV